MSQCTIYLDEITHQIKLSCLTPAVVEGILTRKIIACAAQEAGIQAEAEELQQASDRLFKFNRRAVLAFFRDV